MKNYDDKNFSVVVTNLLKEYRIYSKPEDRLKQFFFGFRKIFYRNFIAIDDVSFKIKPGQCFGIVGKNGAGKSTILQIVAGTLSPSSGSVSFAGKVAAILELGSGFNNEYSGKENIYLYASIFGLSKKLIDERIDSIVEFSELADFINQPIKMYSTGMVARLAFSVIAHVDAEILVIDEALSVGDASFSQKCLRYLREFKKTGTILFVSHDLAAVMAFCDQVMWLEKGKVKLIGSSKVVCEQFMADINSEISGDKQLLRLESSSINKEELSETLIPSHLRISVSAEQDKEALVGAQKLNSFGFDINSSSYGTGEAQIIDVLFLSQNSSSSAYFRGGDSCVIRIKSIAKENFDDPIVGFIIKDRLGQPLIGGNTFFSLRSKKINLLKEQIFITTFKFKLPILEVGIYSITAAVAKGDLQFHTQLHWMHDAFNFEIVETTIKGVMVGVPIDAIDFDVLN